MIFSEKREPAGLTDPERFFEQFRGQDEEVTVEVNEKDGSIIKEGGWKVVALQEGGYVVVLDSEGKRKESVQLDDLIKLQPFKAEERVSLIGETGYAEPDEWVISKVCGNGVYEVSKEVEKKVEEEIITETVEKTVNKSDLIKGKIAKLKMKQHGAFNHIGDGNDDLDYFEAVEKDLKYWQDKLRVCQNL